MLEYCNYSFGKLDIEKQERFNESKNRLIGYNPKFNLREMNVKIFVVITASQQLPIDEDLHKEFRQQAFSSIGYNEPEFSKIHFSAELPTNY